MGEETADGAVYDEEERFWDEEDDEDDYMEDLDEIVEVFEVLPWASPADLERLKNRLEREKDLRRVLYAFKNGKRLEKALAIGWLFLLGQIEYRVKRRSSIYIFVFGTRGMGKSEIGMKIALVIRKSYLKYLGRNHELGFGRSPSELNRVLREATEDDVSVILISDEAEEETGVGSATEEQALIGNLDTMRVLMHSVIRCAIGLRWGFASRCDFLIEPIYQDIDNEINYCVIYTIDPEKNRKVAKYVIDLPLHDDIRLREAYEAWKEQEQKDFTSKGGRRSHLRGRLGPIVDDLVRIAEERNLDPRTWKEFETILVFEVEGGEGLTGRETTLACKQAFKIVTKGDRPAGEEPPMRGYDGQLDDLKQAVYDRLLELGYNAGDIDMLRRYAGYTDEETGETVYETQIDIAHRKGVTQKTVSTRIKALRLDPLALGGAFEDVYVKLVESEGYKVIQGGRNTPTPDAAVYRDDQLIKVLSLKCYVNKSATITVPRSEIAESEWQLADLHQVPLQIVFFDLIEGRIHIQDVHDQQNFTFQKSAEWVRQWQRSVRRS